MAKAQAIKNRKPKSDPARRPRKRRSLAELNAWVTANHHSLLSKARDNSIELTGKPTFGGGSTTRRVADRPKKTA